MKKPLVFRPPARTTGPFYVVVTILTTGLTSEIGPLNDWDMAVRLAIHLGEEFENHGFPCVVSIDGIGTGYADEV